MDEYEVRALFSVTLDVIVKATSPEHAESVAESYIGNECNFTVEQFDDFQVELLQVGEVETPDINKI